MFGQLEECPMASINRFFNTGGFQRKESFKDRDFRAAWMSNGL